MRAKPTQRQLEDLFGKLERTRLIRRAHTTQVGGHVAQYKVQRTRHPVLDGLHRH